MRTSAGGAAISILVVIVLSNIVAGVNGLRRMVCAVFVQWYRIAKCWLWSIAFACSVCTGYTLHVNDLLCLIYVSYTLENDERTT